MAKRNLPFKLVLRKSSPITKAAVLAAIVLSTVALVTLHGSIEANKNRYEALRIQAAILEGRNDHLTFCINNVGTVEGIERIAMEELGLEYPGTVIFTPGN